LQIDFPVAATVLKSFCCISISELIITSHTYMICGLPLMLPMTFKPADISPDNFKFKGCLLTYWMILNLLLLLYNTSAEGL